MNRHWIVLPLLLLAMSLFGPVMLPAQADRSAPPPAGLTLTANAKTDKAAPGDKFDVEVTIKNDTQEKRGFDVPSMWWAKSDQAAITFPTWPRMAGLGPVVTYQQIELEPGKSWSRTWPATVAGDAKEGELEFKLGLTLKRMNQDLQWSNPMKVSITGKAAPAGQADPAVNPLYAAWKGQENKTATFSRQEIISGGAPPVPGQAQANPAASTITCALADFANDHATIKITQGQQAETLTIPANIKADDPAFPKPAGTEELKIGDKIYKCAKYTYMSKNAAEIGRDPQGLSAGVTVWLADGVPGGIVQRQISLTIRASYDITDTLVAK